MVIKSQQKTIRESDWLEIANDYVWLTQISVYANQITNSSWYLIDMNLNNGTFGWFDLGIRFAESFKEIELKPSSKSFFLALDLRRHLVRALFFSSNAKLSTAILLSTAVAFLHKGFQIFHTSKYISAGDQNPRVLCWTPEMIMEHWPVTNQMHRKVISDHLIKNLTFPNLIRSLQQGKPILQTAHFEGKWEEKCQIREGGVWGWECTDNAIKGRRHWVGGQWAFLPQNWLRVEPGKKFPNWDSMPVNWNVPTAALFTADAFRSRILGFSIGTGARIFHQTTQTFVILLHTEEEALF